MILPSSASPLARAFLLFAAVLTGSASAQTSLSVLLGGPEAVPPVPSPGTGSATFDIDLATSMVTVAGSMTGLTSAATGVDLHGPAGMGELAPSVVDLTYTADGAFGGTFTLGPQQLADLQLGLWYLDVHTVAFPSGEIRGQVVSPDGVKAYGSKLNPTGSLVVLLGKPMVGTTLVIGVDNPLGTQGPGSLPFLALALAPDPGTPLPGFGMGGPAGELLISLPTHFVTVPGAPWAGPGIPAPVSVPIPESVGLVGLAVYAQGMLVDPLGSQTFGLTQGAEIILGALDSCSIVTFNERDCTGTCSGNCLFGTVDCSWQFSFAQWVVEEALGVPCAGWNCFCP